MANLSIFNGKPIVIQCKMKIQWYFHAAWVGAALRAPLMLVIGTQWTYTMFYGTVKRFFMFLSQTHFFLAPLKKSWKFPENSKKSGFFEFWFSTNFQPTFFWENVEKIFFSKNQKRLKNSQTHQNMGPQLPLSSENEAETWISILDNFKDFGQVQRFWTTSPDPNSPSTLHPTVVLLLLVHSCF